MVIGLYFDMKPLRECRSTMVSDEIIKAEDIIIQNSSINIINIQYHNEYREAKCSQGE